MARGVEIEWTSKDEQLVRTLQRTEQGMESLMRKMDKVEGASRKAAATTETGFEKATKKITGMATALIGGGSLLTAIDMIKRANEELIRSADEAAKKQEDLFKAFRGQAGLSAIEGEEARRWILANAEKNAVSSEVAKAAAGGLVSAGFSTKDSTVGGLNVLLRARSAYIQAGKDPGEAEKLAKDLAAYMTSQGMAKTPENMEKLMQDAFALRAGAFELSDFAELGKHGSVFAGKLSQQEQLAAFGTLRDARPPAEAGTAFRNIVSRLTTASVGRTSRRALEKIGLSPTDVDLVGENFDTAMGRIDAGLETLPEAERAGVLKLLFEEAAVAPAQDLMRERRGAYANYQKLMADAAGDYNTSANVMQGGPNAAAARLAVRKERLAADRSVRDDVFTQYLDEQLALHPDGSPVRRTMAGAGYWTARKFGASQEQAADLAYGDMSDTVRMLGGRVFSSLTEGPHINMVEAARRQRAIDEGQAIRVEVVNPDGGPAVNQNAVRGFGR